MKGALRFVVSLLFLPTLPFVIAFLGMLKIANRTNQRIFVTPIGMAKRTQQKGSLWIWESLVPPRPLEQVSRFRLEPGATVEILYNGDKIRLTEIVIETQDGNPRQLTAHSPTSYIIDDPKGLDQLNPDTRLAFLRILKPWHGTLADKAFALLLFPCLFVIALLCAGLGLLLLLPPYLAWRRRCQSSADPLDAEIATLLRARTTITLADSS